MSKSENANIACEKLFGRADSKKMKRDRIYKELLNASRYGVVDAGTEILKKHKTQPFEVDELVGEIQALVVENYKLMRKSLKLNNIPDMSIEKIIESCEVDFEK